MTLGPNRVRRRRAVPVVRSVEPAPARLRRAMGLHQGGRGLRPQLRLLCHPVVPGQAALPYLRVHPGRGGPTGGPDGALGRWCWWPRTSPRSPSTGPAAGPCPASTVRPSGATVPSWTWSPRSRTGSVDPPAVSLSVDARRRTGRGDPGHRGARTSTSRSSMCHDPAEAHAAVGGRRAFLDRIALDPARRSDGGLPVLVHHRLPRRDRGRPRPPARVDRGGPAGLGGLLPLQQRGRDLSPPSSTTRCPTNWWPSDSASAPSCRTPSPRPTEDLIGHDRRGAGRRTGVGRTYREAPEIDGIVTVPDDLPVGRSWT